MTTQPLFSGTYVCNQASLSAARTDVVRALLQTTRHNRKQLIDVEIALGELLQNIVRHELPRPGGSTLSVEVSTTGRDLCVAISDDCEPVTDLSFLELSRAPSELGGMGLNLIKKISSSYSLVSAGGKNLHTLRFNDFLTPS